MQKENFVVWWRQSCVCPLIDHRREPIKTQEYLGLLYNYVFKFKLYGFFSFFIAKGRQNDSKKWKLIPTWFQHAAIWSDISAWQNVTSGSLNTFQHNSVIYSNTDVFTPPPSPSSTPLSTVLMFITTAKAQTTKLFFIRHLDDLTWTIWFRL